MNTTVSMQQYDYIDNLDPVAQLDYEENGKATEYMGKKSQHMVESQAQQRHLCSQNPLQAITICSPRQQRSNSWEIQ